MSRHVVRIGTSVFAMHPQSRTMFVTFRHMEHAIRTEQLIRHFIYTHKTLPTMSMQTEERETPLAMREEDGWIVPLQELHVGKIERFELTALCEIHNAGILDVEHMFETDYEPTLNLSYQGYIEEGKDMSFEDCKKYYDYLL